MSVDGVLEAKPRIRASFPPSDSAAEVGWPADLLGTDVDSVVLRPSIGATGSGLRVGELSSLLGGVLKGDIRASKDDLRSSGLSALPAANPGGGAIVIGFAGIFGLSALLTGGGLPGDLGVRISAAFCSLAVVKMSARSGLGARGVDGRVDARLDC